MSGREVSSQRQHSTAVAMATSVKTLTGSWLMLNRRERSIPRVEGGRGGERGGQGERERGAGGERGGRGGERGGQGERERGTEVGRGKQHSQLSGIVLGFKLT